VGSGRDVRVGGNAVGVDVTADCRATAWSPGAGVGVTAGAQAANSRINVIAIIIL